jgi:death-on-curing protein
VMNHPFLDGNKRIAAHVMLIFLSLNKIELEYTQNELVQVILDIAEGNSDDVSTLLSWLCEHQK